MNYLASNSHKSPSVYLYIFFARGKLCYNRVKNIFFNEEIKLGRVVADQSLTRADFSV